MIKHYLGHLPERDPLYSYLKYEIQPQLGGSPRRETYRVFRLNGSNDVYLYEEKYSTKQVIGKFFLSNRERNPEIAYHRLNREFGNLIMIRNCGLDRYPHYVARPLGRNDDLNHLMVIECCYGEIFSDVIKRSIQNRDHALLYAKLTALAYFLATFHNRTANGYRVDFNESCNYMDSLIHRLAEKSVIDGGEAGELYFFRDRWREQPRMWEDTQVYVHGDATPENFLFGDNLSVISFDLERVKRADRVFDTGRVAAELQHFFLLLTGNKYAAEPFIGHFLREYACHFPDRERAFESTTRRVPFYMGITLLRNARNSWFDWNYRRKLVHEAKQCLRRY
ncbi:MAG: aminoglycoside phosphotransferase family protein [Victivallales bacterium]|jgi:aminoglycoside phosphotransferase (APT) family kinase protein|nr:aminoglycoside phosphotransferase family protein [Victivallales bacterium]